MPEFNTNVGYDMALAGSDFGALIGGIGNAVAQTQKQMAQASAETATALANEKVNVIAVQETVYDDNGNIRDANTFSRELPLIDFVDPAFYQWTQVRVQGAFTISEMKRETAISSSTTNGPQTDNAGSEKKVDISLAKAKRASTPGTYQTTTTTSGQSEAVGMARMFAQLNPRTDTGVPKPLHVIQGPSLAILQEALTEVPGEGATPTSRSMQLRIQLRRMDGTPIAGKPISIETAGLPWSFKDPAKTTTDTSGDVLITLERTFATPTAGTPPPDTKPQPVVVSARLGMVANSATVTI